MKKSSQRGIALVAIAGMVLAVHAQDAQYPTITQQPLDQCVPVGTTAAFTVQAANVTGYQWYFNNTILDGQTNSSLVVPNAQISNVGSYSALLFNGADNVPTRSAVLNVYVSSSSTSTSTSLAPMRMSSMMAGASFAPSDPNGGGVIVVFGAPLITMGGSGSCPGKYAGYVIYTKTPSQGWGWSPSTNTTIYTATDTNQSNTKVQYVGDYGDSGCAQTSVTVPFAMSPVYRFGIYFPPGSQVPTNAYPITLSGFNP
jgi:hypothetical protein